MISYHGSNKSTCQTDIMQYYANIVRILFEYCMNIVAILWTYHSNICPQMFHEGFHVSSPKEKELKKIRLSKVSACLFFV